jgi:hypothetical protein
MIPEVTRPCAFVFIRDEDRVLLARMRDPSDGTTFLRPLGGGIDVDTFDGYATPEARVGSEETAVVVGLDDLAEVVLYPDGALPLITGPRSTHAAAAAVIQEGRILLVRRRDDGT